MGRASRIWRNFPFLLPALLAMLWSACVPASCRAQGSARDLHGNPADPLRASSGKVVVLIFVRTDCPVANRYAPTIQALSQAHAHDAVFWMVYPDKQESAQGIRKHEQEFGYQLRAVRDPQHVLVKKSQARVTPEVAVFGADRRLIYHGRIDDLYVDMTRARTAATTHELDDAIRAAVNHQALTVDNKPAIGCYISDLE